MLFVMRSAAIAIPLILVLFVIHLFVSLRMDRTQLVRTEERIADKKPQLAVSADIMKQQKLYRQMLAQLNGWRGMRLDWNRQLDLVRQTVPLEVQLTSLRLSRDLRMSNNVPTVFYFLALNGKTGGSQPESNLTRFRQNLLKSPLLTNTLAAVDVPEGAFVEDVSAEAHSMDRLFQINCTYQPMEFK
jgi:hypothetical protein